MLGVERLAGDKLIFVPSHRRLPHVGAKVALCSPEVLREVANASGSDTIDTTAAEIGFLAFGEFVYAGDDPRGQPEDWMVILHPPILPRFQAAQLVSRRTFVFARAGFGKSNLIKLLFSRLYAGNPVLPSRNGPTPVGTIIFDPDGEYFWPDSGGRPGLADVPLLTERTVVFTSQQPPSPAYGSFVVDSVKLDIRQLSHRVPRPPRPPRILPDLDPPHGNGRVSHPGNLARGLHRLNDRIEHALTAITGAVRYYTYVGKTIAARTSATALDWLIADPHSTAVILINTSNGKGDRNRLKRKGRTKEIVKDKLRKAVAELEAGIKTSDTYTVEDAVRDWLARGTKGLISAAFLSTSPAASCRPTLLARPADRVHKNRGPWPGDARNGPGMSVPSGMLGLGPPDLGASPRLSRPTTWLTGSEAYAYRTMSYGRLRGSSGQRLGKMV